METGIPASSTFLKNSTDKFLGKKSKIPIYASNFKREYLFIRGLNKYFECFIKKMYSFDYGLFKSNTYNTIKNYMKRFLRAQEKGKFNNINNFIIPSYDIDIIYDIILINEWIEKYKLKFKYFLINDDDDSDDSDDSDDDDYYNYDDFSVSLVDANLFPGFKEFHNIFKKIFDQLNYNRYDSESDSKIESEIESYSEIESDSDSE